MMKQIRLTIYLLQVILLLMTPTLTRAQGQDGDYKWVGNPVSDVTGNSNPELNTVYLYNVATGEYLNTGSYWGTSLSAFSIGMPLKLSLNADGVTYRIQSPLSSENGKYLGFPAPPSGSGGNQSDWDRIYCDRGDKAGDHADWVFTEIAPGSKTYTLHINNGGTNPIIGGTRYLHVTPSAASSRSTIDYPSSVSDAYGHWKIITLKDLKGAFKEQFASTEAPADASFLIKDQNFDVGSADVVAWTLAGFSSKKGSANYTHCFSPEQPYTFFVGNRSMLGDDYQRQYGSYWVGSVRNLNNGVKANGTMSQSVQTIKKGWYIVSCDGFKSPGAGSSLSATLFARVAGQTDGRSNVSTELNTLVDNINYTAGDLTKTRTSWGKPSTYTSADVSPYVEAAKLFETGRYGNSILVYVPSNTATLNIGIEVAGSTAELDWTAFDNFQLRYCGDNDMVLDESQTSLEYLTKQGLSPSNAYTLILKRTMKPGVWNSITLPVALTAAQFKTAFGDQAKLARLKGQDENIPTRIDFESVDLSNDGATVINPSQLYIMKSTRTANVAAGSYSKDLNDHTAITVAAPYFTINNVVLAAMPDETFMESPKTTTTEDGNIQFCGTQINQTTEFVPAKSYVLGANNGKWHHTASALPIKGFRCWIATKVSGASPAKELTFAIDGEIEGNVTSIHGLESDSLSLSTGAVYNLQGQKVASESSDLSRLPAGIYIMNNKKVFIK